MNDRTMVSGPRTSRFLEGWAVRSVPGAGTGKAHYFRREGMGICVSLCGSQDAAAGHLYGPGTFERCQRCTKLRDRELSEPAALPPETAKDEHEGSPEGSGKSGGADGAV